MGPCQDGGELPAFRNDGVLTSWPDEMPRSRSEKQKLKDKNKIKFEKS